MQTNQPKDIKPKVRECKVTIGVNWQGVLKQKGIKQRAVKQDLGVYACICGFFILWTSSFPCHIPINISLIS